MAQTGAKDNIADGLFANTSFKAPAQSPKNPAPSPKKSSRKTRSKSIGPGGLEELDAPPLKETAGNRRKVCRVCLFMNVQPANFLVRFHPRSQVNSSLEWRRREEATRSPSQVLG
jgi:hypothetical protein